MIDRKIDAFLNVFFQERQESFARDTNKFFIIPMILAVFTTSLNAIPPYTINRFTESNGQPQDLVTCVTQDTKGYIWISSWNGLSRYDGYTFAHFKARQGDNCPMSTNRILYIRETQTGDMLCKCHDGFYLFKTKEKRFVAQRNKKSDKGDRFMASKKLKELIASLPEYKGIEFRILYHDKQGGYWIYTHKGLDRILFTREKIKPTKYDNDGEEFIRAIFKDKSGHTFIADKNGYVRISDGPDVFYRYLVSDGSLSKTRIPFGANVYSIFEDSKGYIWMGTKPNGLFRLRKAKNGGFIVKSFTNDQKNKYSLNCNSIYCITEDKSGRILLGTYGGGLNIVENPHSDAPRFVTPDNELSKYPAEARKIHDFLYLSNGNLLLGTNGGLFSCNISGKPRNTSFFPNKRIPADKKSLSNDMVTNILRAHDGTIYVATYGGGLNIVESGDILSGSIAFNALTTDNGMVSDVALSLCEDGRGRIWVVSEHSLMEYDPRSKTFSNYTDGFFAEKFSFSEVKPLYSKTTATLLLGTTQGLLTLSTKNTGKSKFKPRIVFDANDTISLSPEEKSLSIGFAAMDYNKNVPIQYAYMLEGVNNDWLYTTDNHINLSNIPAGTFRLKVRSTNGDGVWMDNESYITISRTPYFNERPVAWMMYGGLLIAFVFSVFKVTRYIKQLEKEIKELKLSYEEKMEYIRLRLGDMLDGNGKDSEENAKNSDFIEESDFKQKVEEFMKQNVANPDLDVMLLAREMGMSRSVLYIRMKSTFGCTPNNYVQDYRMGLARHLLTRNKELNVSEVAYRCGFSDPKYFTRCFKKAVGCTPTEQRNMAQKA